MEHSMADLFDKLMQGLNKGITTASVKSKELLDASRLKSQISECERQKKDALAELGTTVCAMLDGGRVEEDVLRTARLAIAEFDEQINERHQELARIHAKAQQALAGTQPAVETVSQASTCACGAPIVEGAKFCASCGRTI
jgi:hypothetical protein